MRFATKTKELSSWRDREPCNIMMTMDATMCRSKVDTSAIFKRFLWSSYFRRNEWRNYEVREYEYKLKMQISIKKLQNYNGCSVAVACVTMTSTSGT